MKQVDKDRFTNLCDKIKFKNWNLCWSFSLYDGDSWIQWSWYDKDYINEGETFHCKGRKWRISGFMTDSEFVQTCFAAAQMAMSHETREAFKFDGRPVMRPHFDVYKLIELCDENAVSVRVEQNYKGDIDEMCNRR